MSLRRFPDGSSERVPLSEDRAGYTATDVDVAKIREYYDGWEYFERRGQIVPDGWQSVRGNNVADRRVVAMSPLDNDHVVEVSYTWDVERLPTDHRVRALSPEEAYQLLLDIDEEFRKRGSIIYDERHPRPATPR